MNQQQKQFKIILIGDSCIDEYHYGNTRPSPEANVPVFTLKTIERKDGMALNVYNNLKQFNLEIISFFGNLSNKKRLVNIKTNEQICRIDEDVISNEFNEFNKLVNLTRQNIDAIIISDYNKGYISDNTILEVQKIFKNTPIFIDTKKQDLGKFINDYNNTFFKINELEFNNLKSKHNNLIITRSNKSVIYKDIEIPVKPTNIVDVCGAGDTFLSSLVYNYLITNDIIKSIEFAIIASSITVQKNGVYAPTLKEINDKRK